MTLLLTLAGLALVDSTSFGTLGIPLVLIVAARQVQVRAMLIYHSTVVVFYFLIGGALMLGLDTALGALGNALDSRAAYWVQLVIGVVLFGLSFRFNGKRKEGKPPRNWIPVSTNGKAMVGLALAATMLEVATMLPYLGAIGLLSTSDTNLVQRLLILAAYCMVMILPAVLILVAASLFGDRLWSRLERLSSWIQRNSEETMGWAIGIVGFFLAADAVSNLGLVLPVFRSNG